MPFNQWVPPFLHESKIFQTIYETQQNELDRASNAIEDILNQCFVDTATWGLKYWEEFLGIPVDESKLIDFRRSTIKAKLRGSGTVTVNLIKNVAESFSNGEVEIYENVAPYTFQVKFVGTRGIPPNIDDLKRAIEEIIPAHLRVIFEYTYTPWNELRNTTWNKLLSFTWEEIRTGRAING